MTPTPAADDRRRAELAEFLRRRRARLEPTELGLPARARRRTPGLRREDVAELAGVSVAWYTSLEQGRPVNPSRRVVDSLAAALRLSGTDRDYLFGLTGHAAPIASSVLPHDTALLQRLVDHMDVPAYCTDVTTTVIAWNALAAEVFGDYGTRPVQRRTLLHLLFEDADFGRLLLDRDDYAARVVAALRGRSDGILQDPDTVKIIEDLKGRSSQFRELWASHDVRRAHSDVLEVEHPTGRLTLALVNLQGVGTPGTRLSAYVPANEESRRSLARLGTR